jgi:hypothetical protein
MLAQELGFGSDVGVDFDVGISDQELYQGAAGLACGTEDVVG